MPKYLDVAADARKSINTLIELVPEGADREAAASLIAHIYNYGIRTAPRPTQSTVRLRAVQAACRDLPLSIDMKRVENDRGGFNALVIETKVKT